MLAAWKWRRSPASRKEQVMGTPSILCGLTAMLEARCEPDSLAACVEEKMAGPPQEASMCSQRLWRLQTSEMGAKGS